jgi:HEAT repeat protein/Tol biopolymer transport system component
MEHDSSEQQKNRDSGQTRPFGHNDAARSGASEVMATFGLAKMARPSEDQLKELLFALNDPEWSVRVATLRALGKMGAQAPVAALVAALSDEHEAVRSAAVRALGSLGRRAPIEPLQTMLHDDSWHVRTASVMALGKQRERVSSEPFIHALHDSDESVRAAAAWALGKQGERAPLNPLVLALQDSAWSVREAAVLALGERGGNGVVGPLLAARMDEDSSVRSAAETTLQQVYPEIEMLAERQRDAALDGTTLETVFQQLSEVDFHAHTTTEALNGSADNTVLEGEQAAQRYDRQENIHPLRRKRAFARSLAEPGSEQLHQQTKGGRHRHPVVRIVGQLLVAAVLIGIVVSWAGIAHLLRPSTGQLVSTASLVLSTRAVNDVAWSRDGRDIATAENGALWIWDTTQNAQQTPREVPLAANARVLALNWSAQNPRVIILAGGQIELVQIVNDSAGTPVLLPRLNAQGDPLVSWSADGQHFAIGTKGGDRRVEFCDANGSCQPPVLLDGLTGSITALALTADGTEIAIASDDSSSHDKNIQLWNSQGKLSGPFTDITYRLSMAAPIIALAWSSQNTQLAYESNQQQIAVWNRSSGNNGNNNLNTPSPAAPIGQGVLTWSPDGQRLASITDSKQVQIWDVVSGNLLYTSAAQSGAIVDVAWSPDGRHLAVTSADGTLAVWGIF